MAMAMAMSIHFPSSQSLTFSSNSPRVSPLPLRRRGPKILGLAAVPPNPNGSSPGGNSSSIVLNSVKDVQTCKSSLEALFCYDKPIPEEIIEKPIGLAVTAKHIGNNPGCMDCQAKGAVLCATCSGTGLYVDSILESQGIIVKVRCLGCGGTGNIMCSECGGRGHL